MDLIITIDTEADNQWTRLKTFTTENARYIPRLQGLCDQFGFKPTYLCTYEMVTDFRCREILGPYQESGRAEIGAHLHPWSNPPFAPELGDWPEHHTFPHELPIDLFEQKMVMLTEAIRQTFGRSPTSYRAGRYGFHASHANVLLHLGYFVDCSVTPYLSWKTHTGIPGGIGGANFREARPGASILGWKENGSREMADGILEVPITILFTRWPMRSWPRGQTWWSDNQKGIPARLLRKLGYGPTWFRPWRDTTARQLISV